LLGDDIIAFYRQQLPTKGWIIVTDGRTTSVGTWKMEAVRTDRRLTIVTYHMASTGFGGHSFRDEPGGYELRECA
jgi:hypothetical protein